jgi:hypothetical protein
VSVVPGISAFDDPPHPAFKRSGLTSLGDYTDQLTALQYLSGNSGVLGAVEVDARMLRQLPRGVQSVA